MADNIDFTKINNWASEYFSAESASYCSYELKQKIINLILEWAYQRLEEDVCKGQGTLTGYVNLGGNVGKCDLNVLIDTLTKIFDKMMYHPNNKQKATFVTFLFYKLHKKSIDKNNDEKLRDFMIGTPLPEDDLNDDRDTGNSENIIGESESTGTNYGCEGINEKSDGVDETEEAGKDDGTQDAETGNNMYSEDNYNTFVNRPLVLLAQFLKSLTKNNDSSVKLKNIIYQIIYSMKTINSSRTVMEMKPGKGSKDIIETMHRGYTETMMNFDEGYPESFCELCKADFSETVRTEKLVKINKLKVEELIDRSMEYYMEPLYGTVRGTISKRKTEFDSQFGTFYIDNA